MYYYGSQARKLFKIRWGLAKTIIIMWLFSTTT